MEKTSVLVVDDEQTIRLLVKKLLSDKFAVLEASDGGEAVDMARKHKPALILMDIMMPNVDGYTACSILKNNQLTKKIPVIMLTTTDNRDEIDRCYEMGCSFYMAKPADYNKFMAAVEIIGTFLSLAEVVVPSINTNHGEETHVPE